MLRPAWRPTTCSPSDRNRGIADPARRIPYASSLGRDEVLGAIPGLDPDGLTGAGVFCDGQMYNPPRLVLAFVQSAVAAGAVCANYVEAAGLIQRPGRVAGVRARDVATGDRLEIRARMVLNAAGPYAERLLTGSLGQGLSRPTPFSRDAYFIVRRPLIAGDHALTVPSQTRDPDAIVSRGGRHLFLVPWRGVDPGRRLAQGLPGRPRRLRDHRGRARAPGSPRSIRPIAASTSRPTMSASAAPGWSRSARTTPTPRI